MLAPIAVVPETDRFLPALAPKLTVSPVSLPNTAAPVMVKELSPVTVPLKVVVVADKAVSVPKVTAPV